jgi:hypothetical protein
MQRAAGSRQRTGGGKVIRYGLFAFRRALSFTTD